MSGVDTTVDRACVFCGARLRFTGTGYQHPYKQSLEDCFFNGVHIGLARMPAWDRGVAKLAEEGVKTRPSLPLI